MLIEYVVVAWLSTFCKTCMHCLIWQPPSIEPPPPHSYNYHLHNTLQPPRAQITTTQSKLLECKCSIGTSGRKGKHQQRKLQSMIPPCFEVEYLQKWLYEKALPAQVAIGETTVRKWSVCVNGQGARCKGQDQYQHKLEWDAATTCSSSHEATNQLRISTGTVGVHNAAIIATCVRAHNFLPKALPICKLQCIRSRPTFKTPFVIAMWSAQMPRKKVCYRSMSLYHIILALFLSI